MLYFHSSTSLKKPYKNEDEEALNIIHPPRCTAERLPSVQGTFIALCGFLKVSLPLIHPPRAILFEEIEEEAREMQGNGDTGCSNGKGGVLHIEEGRTV